MGFSNEILCCGEITIDEICDAEKSGAHSVSTKLSSRNLFYGGRGANFSVFASLFGAKVGLLGAAGGESEGRAYVSYLKGRGVDISGVFEKCQRNSKCFIFNESDAARVFFYGGALLENGKDYINHVKNEIMRRKHDAIYCTSPSQEMNSECLSASSAEVKCYAPSSNIYTHTKKSIEACLTHTDILFLNEKESGFMESLFSSSMKEIAEVFRIGIVAVTMGGQGSRIIENGDVKVIPPSRPERVLDTTGAGDAYAGSFVANYLRTKNIEASARIASAAASFVVEERGCQTNIPTQERIFRRMEEEKG